jgi:putative ABC transport system permease protein
MRPDDRAIDEEIRGHIALNVKERIDRGEDPEAARIAALREFGYMPAIRDSIRRVWYSRWYEAAAALGRDLRFAMRALRRAKGMAITVVITLALGIGANAAIFSVVRSVLLRPLVNRGEDRLVYILQSAPGVGTENMTFSVAEINDLKARTRTISAFGEFSTIDFTMIGVGEPRVVKAAVVNGSYFDVMGLRPVLGRLVSPSDDGPGASPVAVLTYRFWTNAFNSDPTVLGKPITFGNDARQRITATIIGVLEPSVPYPVDTEIIANMATSPHHLGATHRTERTHRMTQLFGRLAPDASVESARAELTGIHTAMVSEHPEAYSQGAQVQLTVTPLRDRITAPARTILLVLLAAAGIVFVIACSNIANLILARSIRREGELAIRAALGAGRGALRRTLLAESLLLCGVGAVLGMLLARPLVLIVARFTARFSVRALEVTVDNTVLWVGAGLALAAAVLLAYVPRLPTSKASGGFGLASGSIRITPSTNRRLRVFATTQIALSFVLLTGAGMLVATLIALQAAATGYDTRQVLVFDVPRFSLGPPGAQGSGPQRDSYGELTERLAQLPGVDSVAGGTVVPWRDAGTTKPIQFTAEGYSPANGEENPYARQRYVGPGFFATLGIPLIAGREFTNDDRRARDRVAIVSQSIAQRLFPNGDALNRMVWQTASLTDPNVNSTRYRIVGVVADVDDENVERKPAMTIYCPVGTGFPGRLFVRTSGDPHALVPVVTRTIRELSADQAIERPATLEDVRAEVLTPERLNTFVVSGFAVIALLIAVVGVAGVLAFSVSARTREFGVRLALGATPRGLLTGVVWDGLRIVAIGIGAGAVAGYALVRIADKYFEKLQLPHAQPVIGAAAVLIGAAILATLIPAARASRVNVVQALRSE